MPASRRASSGCAASSSVCDAVRDCWVSLYTPRAISYRAAHPARAREPAMGVTVQLMVDAEVSGVMFTCNPVSGDPSMVALNASWGLGIGVVGGEVTPDDYLVSKVTGEVVRADREREARRVRARRRRPRHRPAGRAGRAARRSRASAKRSSPRSSRPRGASSATSARTRTSSGRSRAAALPESLLVLQARPVTARPQRARRSPARRCRS